MTITTALAITVEGIRDGQPIPERYAHCVPDGNGKTREGSNIRPAIRWKKGPDNTRSYAIIVVDKDVPKSFESANQSGKIIPAETARRNFYHWVQANIPPDTAEFPESQAGMATPGISGRNGYGIGGAAHGIGYDGPCPPWNDERLHHYHFQVYALDIPSLDLQDEFTGEEMEKVMQGHIVAKGEVIGVYTTNQKIKQAA